MRQAPVDAVRKPAKIAVGDQLSVETTVRLERAVAQLAMVRRRLGIRIETGVATRPSRLSPA